MFLSTVNLQTTFTFAPLIPILPDVNMSDMDHQGLLVARERQLWILNEARDCWATSMALYVILNVNLQFEGAIERR